jgi:hypothetical protein
MLVTKAALDALVESAKKGNGEKAKAEAID